MAKLDPTKLAVMDAVRTLVWWLLVVAAVVLGLYYKRKGSRSQGWKLYLGIFACIVCQAAYMTMWAAHNGAVRALGYGATTDTLYRICIPLYQLAMSSFMVRHCTWYCTHAVTIGIAFLPCLLKVPG